MAKFSVLSGLAGILLLSGCGDDGVEGNGERTEEVRETATFSRIRSNCELDVEAVQADETSVVVSIDSNLQHLVTTRVEDDTLYIDTDDEVEDTVDGPHIRVTLPSLSAAKLSGSGRMAFWFGELEAPVDLYLSGSGALRFEGTAPAVNAFLSGSGSMKLEGETSELQVKLSGSGSVRAQTLAAESARIDLDGSGDVSAYASQSASVSLSGSGDVDLYGDASLKDYDVSGSGDVEWH